jgi:hypothetical protein
MATPHTNKKPRFDTRNIARRLDTMLDTVVKRGVYVIKRLGHQNFAVINTRTGKAIVKRIPLKRIAEQVCDKINSRRLALRSDCYDNATRKFQLYGKLMNDCACYMHTLDRTTDTVTRAAISARLSEARAAMNQIERSLHSVM